MLNNNHFILAQSILCLWCSELELTVDQWGYFGKFAAIVVFIDVLEYWWMHWHIVGLRQWSDPEQMKRKYFISQGQGSDQQVKRNKKAAGRAYAFKHKSGPSGGGGTQTINCHCKLKRVLTVGGNGKLIREAGVIRELLLIWLKVRLSGVRLIKALIPDVIWLSYFYPNVSLFFIPQGILLQLPGVCGNIVE